jgi:hypothetical protein
LFSKRKTLSSLPAGDVYVAGLASELGGKPNMDAPSGTKAPGLQPEGLHFNLFRLCIELKILVGERGFEPPTPGPEPDSMIC